MGRLPNTSSGSTDRCYCSIWCSPTPTKAGETITVRFNAVDTTSWPCRNTGFGTLYYAINGGEFVKVSGNGFYYASYDRDTDRIRDTLSFTVPADAYSLEFKLTWSSELDSDYEEYKASSSGTSYYGPWQLNYLPEISGEDGDLGIQNQAFVIPYKVDDLDPQDVLTVTEALNGNVIRTIQEAARGEEYQFTISNAMLTALRHGTPATASITVSDGTAQAVRQYTFTKTADPEPYLEYRTNPAETVGCAGQIVAYQRAKEGERFLVSAYACNNAFDAAPTWEEFSDRYRKGLGHRFANRKKTAEKWGVSVKFINSKLSEADTVTISGVGFALDVPLAGSAGAAVPSQPEEGDYSWYQTVTQTTVFTAPESGWYRFYVIGKGGNGGSGGDGYEAYTGENYENESDAQYGAGGGGGGTGGYAVHEAYLVRGDTVEITVDSVKVQLQTGDEIVYAEHGGNGGTGGTKYKQTNGAAVGGAGGAGGTAGTASGGNVLNLSGNAGATAETVDWSNWWCYATDGAAGGSGQNEGNPLKYRAPSGAAGGQKGSDGNSGSAGSAGTGSTEGANTLLGMAGGGGGGGGGGTTTEHWESSYKTKKGGAGGPGYAGGVVIEKAG